MLVALHKGEGFIARAIRWQTRSGYSHASVLLEAAELVIEAREFQGVRIVPWAEVMASGEVVDLFRVIGLTEEQEIAVREFLWDQIGKPYDYTMVARFISRRQEERESSGKWFCSELVFAAFAQAGVRLLERIEPWAVSPGMLRLSTKLEEVKPQNTRNTRKEETGEWPQRGAKAGGTGGALGNIEHRLHRMANTSNSEHRVGGEAAESEIGVAAVIWEGGGEGLGLGRGAPRPYRDEKGGVEASSRLGGTPTFGAGQEAESGFRTPKGEGARREEQTLAGQVGLGGEWNRLGGRLRTASPTTSDERAICRQAPTAKCGVHAGSTLVVVCSGEHSQWSMANRQGGACVC